MKLIIKNRMRFINKMRFLNLKYKLLILNKLMDKNLILCKIKFKNYHKKIKIKQKN